MSDYTARLIGMILLVIANLVFLLGGLFAGSYHQPLIFIPGFPPLQISIGLFSTAALGVCEGGPLEWITQACHNTIRAIHEATIFELAERLCDPLVQSTTYFSPEVCQMATGLLYASLLLVLIYAVSIGCLFAAMSLALKFYNKPLANRGAWYVSSFGFIGTMQAIGLALYLALGGISFHPAIKLSIGSMSYWGVDLSTGILLHFWTILFPGISFLIASAMIPQSPVQQKLASGDLWAGSTTSGVEN